MILELKCVCKSFGGLKALDEVDLAVNAGSIHAVIGPNGAGKTTLFNSITGIRPADSGQILWEGRDINRIPGHRVVRLGISRTFQNIRLFPYMTVLENVKVGTHCLTRSFLWDVWMRNGRFRREEEESGAFCLKLLERVGLAGKKDEFARNLPYGEQRKLEIARALASRPRLLLLDEPAAGMNTHETEELDAFIKRLKAGGLTILLIEHDMKLVMSIADIISVLDYGMKIAEGTAGQIQNDDRVIEAYLGKRRR